MFVMARDLSPVKIPVFLHWSGAAARDAVIPSRPHRIRRIRGFRAVHRLVGMATLRVRTRGRTRAGGDATAAHEVVPEGGTVRRGFAGRGTLASRPIP